MPATSERTLRLLTLLQARPVWSGRELAERLETTTRTVRTDIARLRELGYQVEGVPGIAGGYRLRSGENVPPLLFDEDEAVAVLVGLRQMISTSMAGMDAAAESALGKILQLLPARLRNQARAVAEFTDAEDVGHGVDPELIRTLTAACQACVLTRFDYQSYQSYQSYQNHQGSNSRREVEPYRVVNARRRWYLLAWDTDRRDWRTFRLDRMTLPAFHAGARFEPRPLPSEDPAGYVLARLKLMPWPYQAWVIVDAPASELVDRLAPNAVIEPIGERTSRVRLSADSPWQLAPWLGRLKADFAFADPERDADLVDAVDQIRGHFARAVGPRTSRNGLSRGPTPESIPRMEISESPLAEAGRRFFSPENAKTWIELLRPGFHLRAQNEGEPLVGYLGGDPLLPADVAWPEWEGHGPLSFIAAVDCGEIPVEELDIPVPDNGMLLFFYFNGVGDDAVQYLDADSVRGGTRVVYVPEGTENVAQRPAPEGLEAFPRVMLTGELIATAPDNENAALVAAYGDPDADDTYTEFPYTDDGDGFYNALTSFRRDHSPHHRIGGYALPKAGSVTKEAAHAVAPGDDETAKAERAELLGELVMLLQVDSDSRAAMEWGDTGRLYWLITRTDLAARDFAKATFTWQSE